MDLMSAGIGGAAATAFFTVLGGMLKRSINQLDRKLESHDEALQKRADELAAFKLHCAETFVTSSALEKAIDRFSASIDAVFKKLDRIEERLQEKADK
jgi:predicted  nucleic acid-binding Zn-ribbon protein